jgi:hypothetical protein
MKINLNSIDNVKRFVATTTKLGMTDVDLISGRYVISSTSIMGIFSLDLTKPVELAEVNMTEEQKKIIRTEFKNIITE